MLGEAFTPLPDGVSVTVELGCDGLVGGVVRRRGTEDDAATKDQCLRGGAGTPQGLQLAANFRGQFDGGGKGARHDSPPGEQVKVIFLRVIMAIAASLG
jgi:hypothetical protein